jgi:hypothetical protein
MKEAPERSGAFSCSPGHDLRKCRLTGRTAGKVLKSEAFRIPVRKASSDTFKSDLN